jgi:hypothetical protein
MFWWIQHLSISFLPLANLKPFSFYLLLMPNMFKNRHKRNRTKINNQKMKFENLEMQIPDTPPLSSDEKQNTAMNYIRIS